MKSLALVVATLIGSYVACGGRLVVRGCHEGVYCRVADVCCPAQSVCAEGPDVCGAPCCWVPPARDAEPYEGEQGFADAEPEPPIHAAPPHYSVRPQ